MYRGVFALAYFWRDALVSKEKFSPKSKQASNKHAHFSTHPELFQTRDVNIPLLESNFCRTESNYLLEEWLLASALFNSFCQCMPQCSVWETDSSKTDASLLYKLNPLTHNWTLDYIKYLLPHFLLTCYIYSVKNINWETWNKEVLSILGALPK